MRLHLLLLVVTGFCSTGYGRAEWVPPKTGFFWILDSDQLFRSSKILLVDPSTRMIVSSLDTGYQADFALTPDGRYLYVASGPPRTGTLSAINTQTGQTEASTDLADRIMLTGWRRVPSITTSQDGGRIYLIGGTTIAGVDQYYLDIFDRKLSRIQQVPIPGCGVGFLDASIDGSLVIHCPLSNSSKVLNEGLAKPTIRDISLPIRSEAREDGYRRRQAMRVAAAAFRDPTGQFIAVMADGQSFAGRSDVVFLPPSEDEAQRHISFRAWPVRDNGALAFVGSSAHPSAGENLGLMDQIDVLSLPSRSSVMSLRTSLPFWSVTVTPDASTIYTVCPANQTILQIGTSTKKETNAFSGIGSYPLLMELAP